MLACLILSVMITQPYKVYIERWDRGQNMARFYALSIEETLFGSPCLVQRWGRVGTAGRALQHCFDREEDAVALFLKLLLLKTRRGYRTRSSLSCCAQGPSQRPI